MSSNKGSKRILVWDMPTRVFHWLLVLSFAGAWLTAEDDRFLYVHVYAGFLFFGLLVFRVAWGFYGSHHAKFRAFAHSWTSVRGYLKGLLSGEATRYLGHNPAGGWAIFGMLVLGLLVTIVGVVVLGSDEGHGPLSMLAVLDIGSEMKELHDVLATLMLALVLVHVSGVIVESVIHKESLVRAMITGYKETVEHDSTPSASPYYIIGTIMLAVVLFYSLTWFRGYLMATPDKPYLPFQGPTLAVNSTWNDACSECHIAYHPSLLPARSWKKMLDEQNDHFGEKLGLDADTITELANFALANSAEKRMTEAARKIMRSVGANETPLKITETKYWESKHDEIDEAYWKDKKIGGKGNCVSCHLDGKEGTFEDAAMRLPKLGK